MNVGSRSSRSSESLTRAVEYVEAVGNEDRAGIVDTYDYIIVGAGSSGAVLAGRLSEEAGTRVLLLETGPDYRADAAPAEMRSPNPLGITNPELFADYQW